MTTMGRGRSNKNHDPPTSAERPSKRAKKKTDETMNADKVTQPPALPPDAWAAVMECLTLSDVISLSSTCRPIHYDAVPLVTSLHIRYAREMNPRLSQRFRDVREIFIYSLSTYQEGFHQNNWCIDFETSVRAAPFLSNSFPKLERVCFGYEEKRRDELVLMPRVIYYGPYSDGNDRNMSRLIDSISAAFRCGALPGNLNVTGLRCLSESSYEPEPSNCPVCRRACESFPLADAATFEFTHAPEDSYDVTGVAVCLEKGQLEQILESRSGGQDILHSKLRLLHLLGKGLVASSSESTYTYEEPIRLVYYSESQLEEIRHVISYAQLDTRQLTSSELNESIMKSFQNKRPAPPSNTCILSEKSRESLIGLGLQVKEDVEQFKLKVLGQLEQLVDGLYHLLYTDFLMGNQDDWLSIVYKLVSLSEDPPTREVIESRIISALRRWVEHEYDDAENERYSQSSRTSIAILAILMLDTTVDNIDHGSKMKWATEISALVVDKPSTDNANDFSVISYIMNALSPTFDPRIRSLAGWILFLMCANEHMIKPIADANAITKLILVISQTRDFDIEFHLLSVLSCIADGSQAYRNAMLEAGIIKTMCLNLDRSDMLCGRWSHLFYSIVMADDQDETLVKEIANSVDITSLMARYSVDHFSFRYLVDILLMILKKLKHSMSSGDGGLVDEVVHVGAVPAIAKFILTHSDYAESALETLEIIVRASPKHRDELLKTGIIDQLCEGLRGKYSYLKGKCLSVIYYSIKHHSEKRKHFVEQVIALGLVSLLVEMADINNEDEHVQIYAIRILLLITSEQKSKATMHEIAEKGQTVNNLVQILQRGECSESLAQYTSMLLYQIVTYSPVYRDRVLASGIICHFNSGVKAKLIKEKKRWVALISALVSHKNSKRAIQALVDCGAIKSLFELKLESKEPVDSIVESMVIGILSTTGARFITKEKDHIDMLQKKRAWLVLKACREKIGVLCKERDSLKKLKLVESIKNRNKEVLEDIKQKLKEVNTKLCEAHNLCEEAEKVAPPKKWHKQLKKIDLDCTGKVDQEIQRSKLFIEEANSLAIHEKIVRSVTYDTIENDIHN